MVYARTVPAVMTTLTPEIRKVFGDQLLRIGSDRYTVRFIIMRTPQFLTVTSSITDRSTSFVFLLLGMWNIL
ncbi:hypothetical protein Y032_0297g1715 [Ancylostoma ceylanicum]|uniref:Uncharacterized protein n=1 Tax=Ancylostoma ceylanicum TaxID=53326 RepID=A0A016S463_9BILA|nr:hypothetical protein Y032_0297g1715 [Ancylostoma ceylanicum]